MPKQVSGPHFLLMIPGEDSQPRLVILPEGETLLGRSQENDIILKDSAVSREHGRVLRRGTVVRYEDLGDRNLTFIGSSPAHGRELRDGDILKMGHSRLEFHSGAALATRAPAKVGGIAPRRRVSDSYKAKTRSSGLPMVVATAVLVGIIVVIFLSRDPPPQQPPASANTNLLVRRGPPARKESRPKYPKVPEVTRPKPDEVKPAAKPPPAEAKPEPDAGGRDAVAVETPAPAAKKEKPPAPKPVVVRPVVPKNAEEAYFEAHVVPFLSKYCNSCHNQEKKKGELALNGYLVASEAVKDKPVWEAVAKKIKAAEMPPKRSPRPTEDEVSKVVAWIDAAVFGLNEGKGRDPGRVTMRRLNKVEYNYTVRDLVGIDLDLADAFPADEIGYGFDNISDLLSIPPLLMEKYLRAGEKIVEAAWSKDESRERILICSPKKKSEMKTCARKIIKAFGLRAFRRPLTSSETAALVSLVELAVKNDDGFDKGIQLAVQAMLVSPHFLFRVEIDTKPDDPEAVRILNDYELASRLSYFLWSSMPDDELFELARTRSLRRRSVLEKQVVRMLADKRSQALVKTFAAHWLGIRTMKLVTPDEETFPDFDQQLRDAMCRETELFFEEIMKKDLSVLLFIDSDFTFLNQRLAEHYGIRGVSGAKHQRVALEDGRRGGVLTQGTVLTITSDPTRTSPVKRGKWILEQILGSPPPPPPPGADNFAGKATEEGLTLRARMKLHRQNPECAVCHEKMDTIGLGFERFDGIGTFRKTQSGTPIIVNGTFPNGQSFEDVIELKSLLLRHKADFCRCLTEKMMIFALGRGLEYTDTSLVDEISKELALSGYRFSTLVKQIVLSEKFRKRRGEKPLTAVK